MRRSEIAQAIRWVCLALVVLTLGGCTIEVRQSLPAPEVVIPSPGGGERHDLVLVSLGFDPPLQTVSSISAAQHVKLEAVVDNRGTQGEQNVIVTAVLRAFPSGESLAMQTSLIDRLAPGEARVVRFGDIGSAPYATQYAVTVRVASVPGEVSLDNNEGTLYVSIELH